MEENSIHMYSDIDCRACRGLGEIIVHRHRPCAEQSGIRLRCRRCRGTGLI